MSTKPSASRFERLLGDLENLVQEETNAIEKEDWQRGRDVLGRKDSIIHGLLQPGQGIETADAEQKQRLEEATRTSLGNANELGRRMAAVKQDLAVMGRRKGQARGVQKAYRTPLERRPSQGQA